MANRGDRLRFALQFRQIGKQHALAAALKVHESAISRWKINQTMSVENAVSLCKELDISADWSLMGRGAIEQHKLTKDRDDPSGAAQVSRLSATSLSLLNDFIESIWPVDGGAPANLKPTS